MTDFTWVTVRNKDELETLYLRLLPPMRAAARLHGYALGVHGSMRRDLDLVAVPWVDNPSDRDTLARALHRAACGIEMSRYTWETKPMGRVATCFPVCFPEGMDVVPSLGHVDLSVVVPQVR